MARKRLPDEEELSPLSIRIPMSLREQIEQSARRNRRSLNQEVILWLERAAQDFGDVCSSTICCNNTVIRALRLTPALLSFRKQL